MPRQDADGRNTEPASPSGSLTGFDGFGNSGFADEGDSVGANADQAAGSGAQQPSKRARRSASANQVWYETVLSNNEGSNECVGGVGVGWERVRAHVGSDPAPPARARSNSRPT